jgi:soluble lytic murein transglycosylase-like protein
LIWLSHKKKEAGVIPEWAMRLPTNLIQAKAEAFGLDPMLVAAIVWQESRGSVYAVRYEPNYRWLFTPEKFADRQGITVETEKNLQKHSFGLMQIMGATARWLGYDGALAALYKPENNLYWGGKYLKLLFEKHKDTAKVVSAYNAGSPKILESGKFANQNYVDSVLGYLAELTSAKT